MAGGMCIHSTDSGLVFTFVAQKVHLTHKVGNLMSYNSNVMLTILDHFLWFYLVTTEILQRETDYFNFFTFLSLH